MPASTPWWSTPSIAAPRPGRRPTLGLAAAIVASVFSGAAMADPPPSAQDWRTSPPYYSSLPRPAAASPYAVYPLVPYGISQGTCDRSLLTKELVGAGLLTQRSKNLGAKAAERVAAVGNVAPATALVGSTVGRSMDDVDQYCVGRILEYAPDRMPVRWYGGAGNGYAVTPLTTFERDGRYCREYHALAQIDGRSERVYGIACRMPDGNWQDIS